MIGVIKGLSSRSQGSRRVKGVALGLAVVLGDG